VVVAKIAERSPEKETITSLEMPEPSKIHTREYKRRQKHKQPDN